MPNEGDTRKTGNGEWQMYEGGEWVMLDPNDPEMAAFIAELEAGGLLGQFGEAGKALRQVHEEAKGQEGFRRPPDWPKGKPWPPMKTEKDPETGLPQQVEDRDAITWAYSRFGDPYEVEKPEAERFATHVEADTARLQKEGETGLSFEVEYSSTNKAAPYSLKQVAAPKEEKFAGFKTQEEAQARASQLGPDYAPVYNPKSDRWTAEQQEPQAALPGGWPGREQAAPRQQSIEDLITDALVSGDSDRALALDDFRQRPSSFQLAQFAQSLATTPEDFLKIFQALQDYQAKSFEALFAGGKGFAGAVSPDQAARLVERRATGQFGAAPPTVPGIPEPPPGSAAGTPRPMPEPPPGIGAGFAGGPGVFTGEYEAEQYRTNPEYRKFLDAYLAWEQAQAAEAKGSLFGKKPGEPGYEAQQAMAYAQSIGGQGVQALPETPEGKPGGFVVDLSGLTPAQMQSQFGPMAGPSESDIESMTFEELAASSLPDQQKEYWRKRKQARIAQQGAQQGFAQTVAGFMKPKLPLPAPTRTVFTR